jgi:hypothetical protein
MGIEKGDYVRVSYMYGNTKIAKIEKILDKDPCYKNMQMYRIDRSVQHDSASYISSKIYKEDIIKHSKNLIDVIKVGDVITTNNLCGEIAKIKEDKIWLACSDCCYVENIKSIITKEQIKEMEYKINE